MQLECKLELRYSLDTVLKYFFGQWWVGGKIIPRIRHTSAKVEGEVEAELGNMATVLTYTL